MSAASLVDKPLLKLTAHNWQRRRHFCLLYKYIFSIFVFALWGSSCVQTLPIIDTLFRRCYNISKIPEDPEPKIGEKETLL